MHKTKEEFMSIGNFLSLTIRSDRAQKQEERYKALTMMKRRKMRLGQVCHSPQGKAQNNGESQGL